MHTLWFSASVHQVNLNKSAVTEKMPFCAWSIRRYTVDLQANVKANWKRFRSLWQSYIKGGTGGGVCGPGFSLTTLQWKEQAARNDIVINLCRECKSTPVHANYPNSTQPFSKDPARNLPDKWRGAVEGVKCWPVSVSIANACLLFSCFFLDLSSSTVLRLNLRLKCITMQYALSKSRLKQSHKAILYHYPHHHHPEHKHYIIRFIMLRVSQATLAAREAFIPHWQSWWMDSCCLCARSVGTSAYCTSYGKVTNSPGRLEPSVCVSSPEQRGSPWVRTLCTLLLS